MSCVGTSNFYERSYTSVHVSRLQTQRITLEPNTRTRAKNVFSANKLADSFSLFRLEGEWEP